MRYFILFFISSLLFSQKIFCKDNAADAYEKYINQLIPLTFTLAESDAKIRESSIFVEQLSAMQATLNQASIFEQNIAYLSNKESFNLSEIECSTER